MLDQNLVAGRARDGIAPTQAQDCQPLGIPAPRLPAGRFGHDQAAAGLQERSAALGGGRRRGEAPGDHHLEAAPQRTPPGHLGPLSHHLDPVRQAEDDDDLLEELGSIAAPVEQYPGRGRPGQRQRQPGDPGATAEIEDPTAGRLQDPGQVEGALDVRSDGTGTEEAPALGVEENGVQGPPGGRVERGQR